jgi:hypothetical protein
MLKRDNSQTQEQNQNQDIIGTARNVFQKSSMLISINCCHELTCRVKENPGRTWVIKVLRIVVSNT